MENREMRICKKCGAEKDLEDGFSFHSPTGYYSRTCRICHNAEVRESRIPKPKSDYTPSKVCSRCGEKKLRTEDNYSYINKKGGYRKYSKMCLVCAEEFKALHSTAKRLPPNDCSEIRKCRVCETDKPACEFYPTSSGYINYRCIECDIKRVAKRKDEESSEDRDKRLEYSKDFYYKNRNKQLLQTYRKFDFERNYNFDIDLEYLDDLLTESCAYCGFPATGLDRIDDKIGHTKANTIPCCSECNTAKMHNFSYEEMLLIGQTIKEIKLARNKNFLLEHIKDIIN